MRSSVARRSTQPWFVSWTLLLTVLGPQGPVAAQDPTTALEPQVAIGSVRATTGAFPIEGIDDGSIFDTALDTVCENHQGSPTRNGAALAGPMGGSVELEIGLVSCRSGSLPSTRCSWEIYEDPAVSCVELEMTEIEQLQAQKPLLSGEGAIDGWLGTLTVDLPPAIGRYALRLQCDPPTAEGAQPIPFKPLERTLYTTYTEPLAWVSPPPEVWYERATCWARGVPVGTTEHQALTAILRGLYHHGEAYWRYGYATEVSKHHYQFPVYQSERGSRSVEVVLDPLEDEVACFNTMCRCSWRQMVQDDPVCNFGDCYIFSRAFQGIAAVHGIGGLKPIEIYGKASLGFVTPLEAQSFDPEFPSSVICEEGAEPCYPYFFGNHSLRLRDRSLFDATFDRVYPTGTGSEDYWRPADGGPVALSVRGLGPEDIFYDSDLRLRYSHGGYGLWSFFQLLPPATEVRDVEDEGAFRLTNVVSFESIFPTAGGYYQMLNAKIQVLINEPGEYYFKGALYDKKGKKLIAHRPDIHTLAISESVLQGEVGLHNITLTFSGEEIYRSRINGPYQLKIAAHANDESSLAAQAIEYHSFEQPVFTSAYSYDHFGQKSAFMLGDPTVRPVTDDHGTRNLEVTTQVFVRQKDNFAVQARLSSSGHTLGYAGVREILNTGTQTITLVFSGDSIADANQDGQYRVGVNLFDPQQIVLSSWEDALTGEFEAADFGSVAKRAKAKASGGAADGGATGER